MRVVETILYDFLSISIVPDGHRSPSLFASNIMCILQMVLPDGAHVRFGPDKWEDAADFLYPKTIEVKGFCNENAAAAEDEWDWKVRIFSLYCCIISPHFEPREGLSDTILRLRRLFKISTIFFNI